MDKLDDRTSKGRITHALTEALKGGVDTLMTKAFQIEAGIGPFSRIDNRNQWLVGILPTVIEGAQLTSNETARVAMYRDDLRRGR